MALKTRKQALQGQSPRITPTSRGSEFPSCGAGAGLGDVPAAEKGKVRHGACLGGLKRRRLQVSYSRCLCTTPLLEGVWKAGFQRVSSTHFHQPDHRFGGGVSAPHIWKVLQILLSGSGKQAPWRGSEVPVTGVLEQRTERLDSGRKSDLLGTLKSLTSWHTLRF